MAQLKNTNIDGTLNVRGALSAGSTSLNTLYVANAVTFDEAPKINAVSASSILKLSSTKNITNAVANTDYLGPVTAGTWTPTLRGSTTAGSWTYTSRQAKYFKAGRLVHFAMNINAYQSSAGAGELHCSLPFSADSNVTLGNFAGSIGFASGGASNYMRRATYLQIQQTTMTWRIAVTNGNGVWASSVTDIGTGSSNAINVQCSGWYWTAS